MISNLHIDMDRECCVPYIMAAELDRKGFDWPCSRHYSRGEKCYSNFKPMNFNFSGSRFFSAPTLSQVQHWLRCEKGIDVLINLDRSSFNVLYGATVYEYGEKKRNYECQFLQYESALQLGLFKALEMI